MLLAQSQPVAVHIHDSGSLIAFTMVVPNEVLVLTGVAIAALLTVLVLMALWFAVRRRGKPAPPPPSATTVPHPSIEASPMPVEPLTYRTSYDEHRRPGILMAVGVISIVLATFGLLIGIVMSLSTVMELVATKWAAAAGPPAFVGVAGVAVFGAGGGAGVPAPSMTINEALARMTAPNRQMVIAELNQRTPLSPARREMLERLLVDVGDDLFLFDQSTFTPQLIASSITDSGRLPPSAGQSEGNLYYVLINGRIEVDDNDAVFLPAKSNQQPSRVSRPPPATAPAAAAAPVAMPAISLPQYSTRSIVLSLLSGVLNIGAAAYLMVIGILMIRDHRRSRTLHLYYALLKLLLAPLAVWASWSWAMDAYATFASIPGFPIPPGAILIKELIKGIPPLIYPLVLLILLNLPTVRDYYGTWTADAKR